MNADNFLKPQPFGQPKERRQHAASLSLAPKTPGRGSPLTLPGRFPFVLFVLFVALLSSGCASPTERTIKYRVPPVEYEQHEPKFR